MKKIIVIVLAILVIIGGLIAYHFYQKIYSPNVKKDGFIYVTTGSNFEDLTKIISPLLEDTESFVWVAEKKKYHDKIRPGKFKIKQGLNNDELVNYLRSGKVETVTVTFNNQDSFEKLAGRIANQIEADSTDLLLVFKDNTFLKTHNFNQNTAIAMYIPNSYDFYWNTSAKQFQEKMLKEYQKFWNEKRKKQAEKQNLTPLQVSALASIVQKETAKVSERPRVAGLYLNRLKSFWPLQADPTIIYALKQKHGQEFVVKRVLKKDLSIDSPYNTYQNFGVPPGPIGMPDISSINAVLQPENHKYYYMCASITDIGAHEFAKDITQHNINARKYQNWINKQGIKR